MANINFIIDALNISPDDIQSISISKENGIYFISITLKNKHPECPYCGGKSIIKGYTTHHYNHLPIFSFSSVIKWKRIRYVCKDCSKTFSEPNPFGPENFHQTYAVLNQVTRDLGNPNLSFTEIANRHKISVSLVQVYCRT